ncbi:Regulator of G-protein signaling 17, partial [Lamprotornis superbus]
KRFQVASSGMVVQRPLPPRALWVSRWLRKGGLKYTEIMSEDISERYSVEFESTNGNHNTVSKPCHQMEAKNQMQNYQKKLIAVTLNFNHAYSFVKFTSYLYKWCCQQREGGQLSHLGTEVAEMRKRQQSQNEGTSAVSQAPGNQRPNNTSSLLGMKIEETMQEGHHIRPNWRVSSQNPTADEILSWAQNFDKMMKTPAGRNLFREFLRTEYSEENLLFWLACEDLKKEQNKKVIEEKARLIYEDYISILSPKEVSLDSRVREVINRNLLDPSPHMYEDAQLQIYTLMHRDSFPRFLNSQIYKSLVEKFAMSKQKKNKRRKKKHKLLKGIHFWVSSQAGLTQQLDSHSLLHNIKIFCLLKHKLGHFSFILLEKDFKELHGQAVVAAKEAFGGRDLPRSSDNTHFLNGCILTAFPLETYM